MDVELSRPTLGFICHVEEDQREFLGLYRGMLHRASPRGSVPRALPGDGPSRLDFGQRGVAQELKTFVTEKAS